MIHVSLESAERAPFYRAVLGIEPGPGSAGWRACLVDPGASERLGASISLSHGVSLDVVADAPPPGPDVRWVELHSGDLEADLATLAAAGFSTEELPIAGDAYHLLKHEGRVIGGCTAARGPILWLPWIAVADADRVAKAVIEHGGDLLGALVQLDGVGTMVAARDPSGGCFGILRPAEDT